VDRNEVVSKLRNVRGLGAVSDRELRRLAPAFDEVRLAPGQVLTRQGSYERDVYIVVAGCAEILVDGVTVNTVTEGDVVGELAALDGGCRTATVRAVTPMTLLVTGKQAFETLLQSDQFALALAGQMAERLRAANQRALERV
jgi:CRP-like cAMP-binding protein